MKLYGQIWVYTKKYRSYVKQDKRSGREATGEHTHTQKRPQHQANLFSNGGRVILSRHASQGHWLAGVLPWIQQKWADGKWSVWPQQMMASVIPIHNRDHTHWIHAQIHAWSILVWCHFEQHPWFTKSDKKQCVYFYRHTVIYHTNS